MSAPSSLHFASGQFYGGARLSFTSHGIVVTHRVADREPDEVLTHTHGDAHFVLISGGDYVSIAKKRMRPAVKSHCRMAPCIWAK